MKLFGESQQQGLSIIPLELYIKRAEQSSKSGFARAKSSMTSALLRQKRLQTDRLSESLSKDIKFKYGDERISTGSVSLDQRVAELHRYKSNNLKLTDNNRTVLKAA